MHAFGRALEAELRTDKYAAKIFACVGEDECDHCLLVDGAGQPNA
jgi:hypothetical protein